MAITLATGDRHMAPHFGALIVLGICLTSLLRLDAGSSGCPKRVVRFKITESDIAEIERGEAEGHQPWRDDAHTVAEVGLGAVEPKLDPRAADQIPFKRTIISSTHESFTFKLTKRRHVDQITVRRLHWRNPRTGKTQLTVWWATEAMILDCPKSTQQTRKQTKRRPYAAAIKDHLSDQSDH